MPKAWDATTGKAEVALNNSNYILGGPGSYSSFSMHMWLILFVIFLTDRVIVQENSVTFDSVSYTAAPHYETPESGPMPEYEEITDTEREPAIKEKGGLISAKSQSDSFSTEQQSPKSGQEYTFVS